MSDIEQEIFEVLDLVDFTLSNEFINKWKYKYSEKFIKTFQIQIFNSFKSQKPIRIKTLFTILKKNNKYSDTQIENFFNSIDIDLYRPIIIGSLK